MRLKPARIVQAIIYARYSPRPSAETLCRACGATGKVAGADCTPCEGTGYIPLEHESCKTQEGLCRERCERLGIPVVSVFHDKDISGDEMDRPQLWDAIKALQRGWVLVVRDQLRLARSPMLQWVIEGEVRKRGARVEYLFGVNGESDEAKLARQILAAVGEYQKAAQAKLTSASALRSQRAGRRMSARLPYGWMADGNSTLVSKRSGRPAGIKKNQAEQEVIAQILAWHSAGAGPRTIKNRLEFHGILARGGKKIWSKGTIEKILLREANCLAS